MQSTPITKVFRIFSPTYVLADWRKNKVKDNSGRAHIIIKYDMNIPERQEKQGSDSSFLLPSRSILIWPCFPRVGWEVITLDDHR